MVKLQFWGCPDRPPGGERSKPGLPPRWRQRLGTRRASRSLESVVRTLCSVISSFPMCVTNVLLRGCSEEATNWNSSTACQIALPTCECVWAKTAETPQLSMRMCSSGKQSFKKLGPGRQGLCGSSGEYTYQGYMGTPASFVVSPDTFCIQWILSFFLFPDFLFNLWWKYTM